MFVALVCLVCLFVCLLHFLGLVFVLVAFVICQFFLNFLTSDIICLLGSESDTTEIAAALLTTKNLIADFENIIDGFKDGLSSRGQSAWDSCDRDGDGEKFHIENVSESEMTYSQHI